MRPFRPGLRLVHGEGDPSGPKRAPQLCILQGDGNPSELEHSIRLPHGLSVRAQRLILRLGITPPVDFQHQALEQLPEMHPREFTAWGHTASGLLVRREIMADHPLIAEISEVTKLSERDIVASAIGHATNRFEGTSRFANVQHVNFGAQHVV